MVAFRRNRSLRDTLVRARYDRLQPASAHALGNSAFLLQKNMATSTHLTNERAQTTVKTAGGNVGDRRVVYAAKCRRCQLIYVGHTTISPNKRFNIHRSDIAKHPDRSELPKHFNRNVECQFNEDLEVHILQRNIGGSRALLEAAEDKWIIRLNECQTQ